MNEKKMMESAKNLDLLTNVFGKLSLVAGCICIVVAIFTYICGTEMFTNGGITFDLDFIKLYLKDTSYVNVSKIKMYVCIMSLFAGIVCFMGFYISKNLRKIFSTMKNGRPFEQGVSKHLKTCGWVIFVGGFICELLGVLARILMMNAYTLDQLFNSEVISHMEYVFTIDFNFVLIACALFLLSYIFEYGQMLQIDVDETL